MKQKTVDYNIAVTLTFLKNYIRRRIRDKHVDPQDINVKSLQEWVIKKASEISGASQRAIIRYIRLNK